jgi:hypothetical protein
LHPPRFHLSSTRTFLKLAILSFGLLLPAPGQQPAADPKKEEGRMRVRFICVSSLENEQELVLASHNDKGEWQELGKVKLRPSFIMDWVPAGAGELHLAIREAEGLKSVCQFKYPTAAPRALVVLIADTQNKVYRASVMNPAELQFTKGSVLLINFSSLPGMVLLGSKKVTVNSGQRVVAKPALETNGMYRMMVAYLDPDKKTGHATTAIFPVIQTHAT